MKWRDKMIINISGYKKLEIKNIICDFNGTLAVGGKLISGVKETINKLSKQVDVYVITADTFGSVKKELEGVNCKLVIISGNNQVVEKLEFLESCNKETTVCIGNGRNDKLMLEEAALGIALIQDEGVFIETMQAADIVCKDINHAFELFIEPKRVIATLRN